MVAVEDLLPVGIIPLSLLRVGEDLICCLDPCEQAGGFFNIIVVPIRM